MNCVLHNPIPYPDLICCFVKLEVLDFESHS